jgi:ankyrin repeat protein
MRRFTLPLERPIQFSSKSNIPSLHSNSFPILQSILSANADPTLADDEGNTALHFAAKTGHSSSLGLLLEKSGDRRMFALRTNLYGDTALHSACYTGRMDAAKQLLGAAGSEVLSIVWT